MGFRKQQLILRESPGGYNYDTGKYVKGSRSHFSISASVQPLTADELKTLPEGRRTDGMVKVYTKADLQAGKQQTDDSGKILQPDRLVWSGRVYELTRKNPYSSGVINHFKYIFNLIGELSVPIETIWDDGDSVWDNGGSVWDNT